MMAHNEMALNEMAQDTRDVVYCGTGGFRPLSNTFV